MGLVPIAGTVFGDGPSRGCRVGVINQEAAEAGTSAAMPSGLL